jgi:hypothetical protein
MMMHVWRHKMDFFELPPLFIMLVVIVIMFVIIGAASGKRLGPGGQRVCRACGAGHPRFARFCRRCGRQL